MPHASYMLERYVIAAAVVLTCVLFTAQAADPVNVLKLTALMLCALVLVGSFAYRAARHRVILAPTGPSAVVTVALVVGLLVSAWTAPVTSTAVLGAYGRNSGLLAYLAAVLLFLSALVVFQRPHTRVLLGGVLFAGMFTAVYGLLQKAGVDAIPWNNPFNPVIAALGNPNFASGYLGVAASVTAGGALWTGWGRGWRVTSGATSGLCLLAAALSSSVQGPIAAAAGLFVIALAAALGSTGRRRAASLSALGGVTAVAVGLLLVAALTKAGPLGRVFTDYGSQARVHYWQAALDMFSDKPWLGVGLDQYGSFWRSSRTPEAVTFLGPSGYSDAAHSVPLQVLAQGGLLLGTLYVLFVGLVLVILVRGLLRLEGADRMLLAAMGAGWAAYQVQSFVSIDQVPLIVLHFTLAGGVVAAAGGARLREVRLPGALQPAPALKSDERTRRRIAAAAPPRRRQVTTADVVVLSVFALCLGALAWQSLVPLRANVAVQRGDSALAAGQGNAALEAYETATDLVPGQPVYWGRQAKLFSDTQQPDLARRAHEEAADVDPFDVNALRNAAAAAELAGDLPIAEDFYKRALEVDPIGTETVLAATTYHLRHRGADYARTVLEAVVQQVPTQAALWATLGDARLVLGDPERARQAYERALTIEPGQATATEGLTKVAAA